LGITFDPSERNAAGRRKSVPLKWGVHRTYVGGVERGEYNLTVLTLSKFCRALGISTVAAMQGMERELKRRK